MLTVLKKKRSFHVASECVFGIAVVVVVVV